MTLKKMFSKKDILEAMSTKEWRSDKEIKDILKKQGVTGVSLFYTFIRELYGSGKIKQRPTPHQDVEKRGHFEYLLAEVLPKKSEFEKKEPQVEEKQTPSETDFSSLLDLDIEI